MKKNLISILILLVIANVGVAQTFNLSKETVKEYKEIMEEYEDMVVGEKILGIAVFWDIYDSDPVIGTFKVVIDGSDWSSYLSAIKGFKSFVHERMATVCGKNALSSRISKNSSDKKFWQKLYEYHTKMR
jgi:hypothetical protein